MILTRLNNWVLYTSLMVVNNCGKGLDPNVPRHNHYCVELIQGCKARPNNCRQCLVSVP